MLRRRGLLRPRKVPGQAPRRAGSRNRRGLADYPFAGRQMKNEKGASKLLLRHPQEFNPVFAARSGIPYVLGVNSFFNGIDGSIDMPVRAPLQSLGKTIVFIMADILACFPQEIQGYMQTTVVVIAFIDRGMIFQVFAIFDSGFLNFANGGIDPAYSIDLVYGLLPVARAMFDHPAGCPQIGQSMQVIRMISGPSCKTTSHPSSGETNPAHYIQSSF